MRAKNEYKADAAERDEGIRGMSNYVGIVRSDLRLKRAWDRLDLLYEDVEKTKS